MNEQLNLGEAYARSTDPGTSHAAARSVEGQNASRMEAEVLRALRDNPCGLTSHDIVDITGLNWNTATPRIRPLVRKGLVVDSGVRVMGHCHRKCIVWKAV